MLQSEWVPAGSHPCPEWGPGEVGPQQVAVEVVGVLELREP